MIMKTLARILIGFYKRFISINLTRPCIYVPTCSIYTLTAIEKHGFFKGCVMGAKGYFDAPLSTRAATTPWQKTIKETQNG